jgi:hypothetical protein
MIWTVDLDYTGISISEDSKGKGGTLAFRFPKS